jgi:curved DNA-binding protein CbpA
MTYDDLKTALEVFGIPDQATLKQIKARHRELVKRFHPDRGEEDDPERIRLINAAYRLLTDYCRDYLFSFGEAEFYRQNPDEQLRMQYRDVPHWGSR